MAFPLRATFRPVPLTVPLLRGVRADPPNSAVRLATLGVPLAVKLVGAHVVAVVGLFAVMTLAGIPRPIIAVVWLVAAIAVYSLIMLVALRPIRDLEIVASRVWRGDLGARVERSAVADTRVIRIGSMFNILLDGLVADRARLRTLATEVIAAGDRERSAIARELHDSTAQHIAALLLQLSTAARDTTDRALAERLGTARDTTKEILEEVRTLSHAVHPRVLDDLGLPTALRKLARDLSRGNGIDIDVNANHASGRLPASVETVLYRVAQEAVRNATRHAAPRRVRINLYTQPPAVTLEVHDDGSGFDLAQAESTPSGLGLQSMRERLSLVDGWLDIKTARGSGTTVSATIPLDRFENVAHEEIA